VNKDLNKTREQLLTKIEQLKAKVTELEQTEIERKIAVEALKKSEKKFSSIVESSPVGMHIYSLEADDKLIFLGANASADILLGIDNSQFTGKTIEKAFSSTGRHRDS